MINVIKNNFSKLSMVVIISTLLSGCWTVQEGEKIGEIIDLKQSGLWVKTWECKIIRGGLQDGSGTLGTSIDLTIEDKNLLDKTKRYMLEKKIVSVKYHVEAISWLRSDSRHIFLDSIDEINQ